MPIGHLPNLCLIVCFFVDVQSENVEYPVNAATSDWYSEREGTDTVLISRDNVALGDVYQVSVFCMNACQYDLRTYMAEEIEID